MAVSVIWLSAPAESSKNILALRNDMATALASEDIYVAPEKSYVDDDMIEGDQVRSGLKCRISPKCWGYAR